MSTINILTKHSAKAMAPLTYLAEQMGCPIAKARPYEQSAMHSNCHSRSHHHSAWSRHRRCNAQKTGRWPTHRNLRRDDDGEIHEDFWKPVPSSHGGECPLSSSSTCGTR